MVALFTTKSICLNAISWRSDVHPHLPTLRTIPQIRVHLSTISHFSILSIICTLSYVKTVSTLFNPSTSAVQYPIPTIPYSRYCHPHLPMLRTTPQLRLHLLFYALPDEPVFRGHPDIQSYHQS